MRELKPCPFCGSRDVFIQNIRMRDPFSTWPLAPRTVICSKCGLSVTFGYESKSPKALTDEEVKEARNMTVMEWNRRAQDET